MLNYQNIKFALIQLKQQIFSHPDMVAFLALLSSIISFIIKTWQFNIILFLGLFFLIVIDTFTGVRRAKKAGAYDYRIMKEKTVNKVLGYIIFLLALGAFTIMLFVLNLNNTIINIPDSLLNIPLMTSILFFAGVEMLSINDNLKNAYGIKTPSSVMGRVEKFVDDQDISKLTNKDNV
ncbi:phage holin family protein [Emticicia sp. BO119]|uniref:phage holin family protein n=1 Tax=Emticicia sp. BO119 TaxID=2757768 RepID=UPI0015F0844E|nr:phage holin family protein [Emticicia sp. BO119]MBA4852094.1 phage holin family protein [Emticicia sp. BO119]